MPRDAKAPDGWRSLRLAEIVRERNQRADSGPKADVFSVTKHRGFVRSLEYFVRQVFSRDTSNYKVVRRGDLAYATIHLDEGSLGILRDADAGLISPMYTVFEVDREQVEPAFLFALMKLPTMVARYQRIGEGSIHRRKSISFERLGRLIFIVPVIEEQRRILSVLDAIDEAIERTEAVIAATERLRDSLLHELLTRGVPGRHREWKEVAGVGTVPACWEVVRLEEVAEVNPKRTRPRLAGGFLVTFVPMAAVGEDCSGIQTRVKRPFREVANGYTCFREGDILFSKITPCLQNGKHALASDLSHGIGFGTTEFHVICAGPRIRHRYLFRTLTRPSNIERCTKGFAGTAGQQRVQPETLRALRIPVPSLTEQQTIGKTLNSVADSVVRIIEKRDRLRVLKDSVSEALLTGRLRVD